jgi:hypothetical protein
LGTTRQWEIQAGSARLHALGHLLRRLIDDVRIYNRAVKPSVVSTTNGMPLVFVSFQLALDPSSVGFNALPAFSVVLRLVVVHPDKTGVASLYGSHQHNHPHLPLGPSDAMNSSAGHPFPA